MFWSEFSGVDALYLTPGSLENSYTHPRTLCQTRTPRAFGPRLSETAAAPAVAESRVGMGTGYVTRTLVAGTLDPPATIHFRF